MLRRLAASLVTCQLPRQQLLPSSSSTITRSSDFLAGSPAQSTAGAIWAWLQQTIRSKSTGGSSAGLKVYKPTTPGLRGRITTSREGLWKGGPYKPLAYGKKSGGGRNNTGTVTAWHRGGGHKRLYRMIDFRGGRPQQEGTVQRIEYDPNRSARIALVKYGPEETKEAYSYMLAPQHVTAGHAIRSGPEVSITIGNTMALGDMPAGTQIHNIELRPGKGGQMVRAAGTSATLVSKGEDGYALVRLPSGEQRAVLARCTATIGAVSNPQHQNRKIGRAGSSRRMGRRPTVRGVAMNSVDHPHGGGRGKSKGRISQTPWGVPTKGYRTRRNPRTDQYIRLSRHKVRAARR